MMCGWLNGFGWGGFGGLGNLGWIGMIVSLVLNLAVVIGIVVLVVWAIRRFSAPAAARLTPTGSAAQEILQARYARGEITREQYQEMLADLSR